MPKLLGLIKVCGAVLLLSASPTTSMAQSAAVDDVIQGAGGQSLRETFSNHAAEIAIREAREQAAREASEQLARQTPLPSQSSTASPVVNNSVDLTSHGEDIQALIAKKHEDAARAASQQTNQQAAVANLRQGMDQIPQGKPREELGAAIHGAEQRAAREAAIHSSPTPRVNSTELPDQLVNKNIRNPENWNGCENCAQQIQKNIGGDIHRITPIGAPSLGGYRGVNPRWSHHDVVVKESRVYDGFSGQNGETISDYKNLFQYPEAINFGF